MDFSEAMELWAHKFRSVPALASQKNIIKRATSAFAIWAMGPCDKVHLMSDPQKYRTKEEVEEYKHRDPIEQIRKTILDKKFGTEKDLDAIGQKINSQVEEAVKFAEESKYPDASEALHDIYAQPDYPFI